MMVLLVDLKVFLQGLDSRCKERNLDLWTTSVLFVTGKLFDDLSLYFCIKSHFLPPIWN